ncbi:MAG TPA: twin-arginine translocase subunit TatC [Candidatus Brocadiia bacterium]|nr:twin-arginine translocase subunit TatC [Candidatus Brocadiia bacterium]
MPSEDPPEVDRKLPLGEHFAELRVRVMRSLAVLIVGFMLGMARWNWVFAIVSYPHERAMRRLGLPVGLIQTGYFENVLAMMKSCFIVAAMIGSPFIAYEVWAFVSAGLYQRERSYVRKAAPFVFGSFLVGALFGYFVMLPYGFEFVLRLSPATVTPQIKVGEYVTLFFTMTFMLGLVFQTPLVMLVIERINIVKAEDYIAQRKYAIIGAFVLGAVLTPSPDVFSQALVAVPIILLYEVGILLVAPTRRNIYVFARGVTLAVLLVVGGIVMMKRWPVADAQVISMAEDPTTTAGGNVIRVPREKELETGPTERMRITSGGKNGWTLVLGPGTSLIVDGKDKARLNRGELLILRSAKSKEVFAVGLIAEAKVDCEGDGEILFDERTSELTLTAMKGNLRLSLRKQEHVVEEGRSLTVNLAGRPADIEQLKRKWHLPGGAPEPSEKSPEAQNGK